MIKPFRVVLLCLLIIMVTLPGCDAQQSGQPPGQTYIDPPFEPMPPFPAPGSPQSQPQSPVVVVPPSPNAPAPVPTVTPSPSVPGQAIWPNIVMAAEAGISIKFEVDSNSPNLAGRVYWKSLNPVCLDCYFVGLDGNGRSLIIDFMSRGKTSGECDVLRVDVERIVKWAIRPSQY